MQLRWIAIGVVCLSAALLSACGQAPGNTLSARSSSAAMSKSGSRYDASDKDKSDNDECDESEDHDKSSSRSLMSSKSKSKDDDRPECKDDGHDKSSGHYYGSKSMSVASKSTSKDDGKNHDKDDDDTCAVTICHVPSTNKCKPHKMRVSKSDCRSHFEHGDYPGACDQDPGPVDPPAAQPPVANAGPAQTVASAAAVALDGSASKSPAGLALAYQWSQTAGPAVTLANAKVVNPSFGALAVPFGNSPVALTFSLVVTDANGTSAPSTVTITVNAAPASVPTCDLAACPQDPNGNGEAFCNADGSCGLACFPGTILVDGACMGIGG